MLDEIGQRHISNLYNSNDATLNAIAKEQMKKHNRKSMKTQKQQRKRKKKIGQKSTKHAPIARFCKKHNKGIEGDKSSSRRDFFAEHDVKSTEHEEEFVKKIEETENKIKQELEKEQEKVQALEVQNELLEELERIFTIGGGSNKERINELKGLSGARGNQVE